MSRRGRRRQNRMRYANAPEGAHGPPPIIWNSCSGCIFIVFWLGFLFLNVIARDIERFGFPWPMFLFLCGFTIFWILFSILYTKQYKKQHPNEKNK